MGIRAKRIKGSVYILVTAPGKRPKARRIGPDNEATWQHARALVAAGREAEREAARPGAVPTLAAMAARYLREDVATLAPTTRGDRPGYLRHDGVLRALMPLRLDAITVPVLRGWWGEQIEGQRSDGTGRHYLDILQAVYAYAIDLGIVDTSPVPAYRLVLRRRLRGKGARAAAEASVVRPLTGEEAARVLAEARAEGPRDALACLLGLDAGLRLGEIVGLCWGHVAADALHLDATANRPRGGEAGPPKSGRGRRVELSRRLASALEDARRAAFMPGPDVAVLPGFDASGWRRRGWRRICTRAAVGQRRIHDLRDTYASQLVSAGIPLAYVAEQLGHADMATTARHYARWITRGRYVAPPTLGPGEVPADLISRCLGSRVEERRSM